MKKKEIVSTTHFYNAIAEEYDKHLTNSNDEAVRKEVADFLKNVVPTGRVMDFGGGTGLDLPWLIESGYQIFFCEPAANMRSKAMQVSQRYPTEQRPFFVEHPDFKSWQQDNLPFKGKLNAILANFGVVNYIDDLTLLFEKFSFLSEDQASIVINQLYASPTSLLTKYFRNTIKAVIRGEKIKSSSQYHGLVHEATLYSIRDIEKAASKYFVLKARKKLGKNSDFILLHLVKR